MTSFTRQYSFPNVSVKESVRGPQEFNAVWRNTIGVAAPFSRGPLVARISSRQELVNLFGEDNSLGSIAVRQAMLQGATNFVISRALPKAKGSFGSINLANPRDPLSLQPLIGSTDNRTVGLITDFSFISNVISPDGSLSAYATNELGNRTVIPEVNTGSFLENLDFDGIGSLSLVRVNTLSQDSYDFFLRTDSTSIDTDTEQLVTAGFEAITSSNISATLGNDGVTPQERIFKVIIPKSALPNDRYVQAFVPGMRIKAGTTVDGIVFTGDYGEIVSELENKDALNYFFYVKATVASVGADTSFKLEIPAGLVASTGTTAAEFPIIDVYRLFFTPNSNEVLPGDVHYFGATPSTTSLSSLPVGYLLFDRKQSPGVSIPISYYTNSGADDSVLSVQNTSVMYKVGEVTDSYVKVVSRNQTINIAKTSVYVGETDQSIVLTNPNTPKAFTPNQSVSSVLTQLKDQLMSNNVLTVLNSDVVVNISTYPYSLTINLGAEGEIGNNLIYRMKRVAKDLGAPADIIFEDNGENQFDIFNNFIGGVDAIVPATRFFYNRVGRPVLYVEALSPGASGNNIRVNVRPIDDSNFLLEVREVVPAGQKALPTESYYLSNTTVDLATGIYPETLSSKLIKAYYVPVLDAIGLGNNTIDFNQSPVRVAPPDFESNLSDVSFPTHPSHIGSEFTQNIALVKGKEPANYSNVTPEEAYLDAIDRLNEQDVAFIMAPGLVAGDVRYERAINSLIQQADQATPYNGLRIAILSAPPKLTPSRAELLNSQYSSPNLVIVGGWSSLATARGIGLNQYSPEGFYAGLLSVTDTYISPASSFANNFVVGVRNVDTDARLSSLDSYTNNNIEMLYLDRVSGKVKFLHGRTTAGNLDNRWISIRRQSHHLIMNIVTNLEWARSAPNDPETRARVASAVDALLKTEQRRGAIAGFSPSSIDGSNPDRIAQGYMDIVITWTPVFPADYISVELIRTISNQFSLQLNA